MKWLIYSAILSTLILIGAGTALVTHKHSVNFNPSKATISKSNLNVVSAPQDTSSNTSTPTTKSNPVNTSEAKTYVSPTCTIISTPYQIVTKDADWLYVGQTRDYAGFNGMTRNCTASSDGPATSTVETNPIDGTHYIGTVPLPPAPNPPPPKNVYPTSNNCSLYGDSSAYQQCLMAQ